MVRNHPVTLIGERFEPAKALKRTMQLLAWQRRGWMLLTAIAWLLAVIAITAIAFAVLYAFALRISPFSLLWLMRTVLVIGSFVIVAIIATTICRILHERFHRIVAEADKALGGGDLLSNALDLAKISEHEQFVSPTFAKIAIVKAWQHWQEASANGIAQMLTYTHRRRAAISLTIAVPLVIGSLVIGHWSGVSVTALLSLYRDTQAVLEFERDGHLRLRISDDDGVVLKGSAVWARVQACKGSGVQNMPSTLSVWLRWQTNDCKRWLPMNRVGENEFEAMLTVSESGTLQAVCGKVKGEPVRVRAVLPPRVTEWLVTVEPPAYTGLPTENFTTDKLRPLSVLKGTTMSITATASAPLRNAQWTMTNAQCQMTVDRRMAQMRFVVMRPIRWRLRLVDRYGFEGETNWHDIFVWHDKPPQVIVLSGASVVIAGGFAPLTIRAEDDFGVSDLALQFSFSDTKRAPTQIRTVPLTIAPQRQIEQSLVLPLPITAVGNYLWVRGLAKDNDEVSGAKTFVSQWLVIRIGTPEEIIGTPQDWLERLRQLKAWMQKGDWQKARQEIERWKKWWQQQLQQAQWFNRPMPHQWLVRWLEHLQEHLRRSDTMTALQELWQMKQALERAIGEQRLTELAQEAAALRAMQEAISEALGQNANLQSLTATQQHIAKRTERLQQGLEDEMKRWEKLGETEVAFVLHNATKVLEHRPTTQAMKQAGSAMQQGQTDLARQRSDEALSDLRKVEERLTSPTQSPLAQIYRRERNRLAQLLEKTERLRREQRALRQKVEGERREAKGEITEQQTQRTQPTQPAQRLPQLLEPPSPPSWSEVEKLTPQMPMTDVPMSNVQSLSLAEWQGELRKRTEGLQRPLQEAIHTTPQLSPETPHHLQDAVEEMQKAESRIQKAENEMATTHQRQAEQALQRLADALRQALQMEQGTATQRMGAGENEAMQLAQRQAKLLRETQRLHQQRQQGQRPSQSRLQGMGAEEGNIRRSLSRMEGFFADALPPELRQRLGKAQEQLQWLEENLPKGEIGQPTQGRQQQVLEMLLELAQALSGQQQGNQQGQQIQRGQMPSMPDINWGRFIEHGLPMREVPEALRGEKGSTSFVERAKGITVSPLPPIAVQRVNVPPAYQDAVQKYQRQLRR